MFFPIRFKTSVQLAPTDLHDDFDIVILKKLRKTLEGVCSRFGYIKKNSITIVKRSAGKLMKQHFNGYVYFVVLCKAEVCNPAKDTIIETKVVNKNALGILAESYIEGNKTPVLDIIVPKRTAGIVSEIDVDTISIGDTIHIMVIGKRFQLNDKKISIIGKVVRNPNQAAAVNNDGENVDEGEDVEAAEDEYGSDSDVGEEEDGEEEDEEGEEEADEAEEGGAVYDEFDKLDLQDSDEDNFDEATGESDGDEDETDGADAEFFD